MESPVADVQRVRVRLGSGHRFSMEDALKTARLRVSTNPADLTEKEKSIAKEVLDDPVIQVRLRNWLMTKVLAAVDGALWFVPFKKRILKFVWDKINKEIDESIEELHWAAHDGD